MVVSRAGMPFDISAFLTETEKVVKIIGVILAGGWAYYHYFRGRTYRPRLEPGVSATFREKSNSGYVIALVELTNVGLSRFVLDQARTGLVVLTCNSFGGPMKRIQWTARGAFPVFESHDWIEPGETIKNRVLFEIGNDEAGIRLELVVGGPKGLRWLADEIVTREVSNGTATTAATTTATTAGTTTAAGSGDGTAQEANESRGANSVQAKTK